MGSQLKSHDDNDVEVDAYAQLTGEEELCDNKEEEEDEEDGPVLIPYGEIEASNARSLSQVSQFPKHHDEQMRGFSMKQRHSQEYPLLYASMSPGEDEVMACARILDEKKDVSLVRGAAAYLVEVEAHRGGSF